MIDRDALAARVRAVDADARVDVGDCSVRVRLIRRNLHIGIWQWPGMLPDVNAGNCKSARDRAILRAVLDYLDETEGV